MGLAIPALRYLVREHLRRPFDGPVLTLGRQCVYATIPEILALLDDEGIVAGAFADTDARTNIPGWALGLERGFTSDRAFFAALGGLHVEALDVSDYERPDHLCDLNQPVPEALRSRFGLIVDGGTLEHVFDTRQALANVAAMLATGGRVIHMSPATNYIDHGFYQFSPTLFFDYYGANGFDDMHCLIADQDEGDSSFHEWYFREWNLRRPEYVLSAHPVLLLFRARKGPGATIDRVPQQGGHRATVLRRTWRAELQPLVGAIQTLPDRDPLAVFGAGEIGRMLCDLLAARGIAVAAFVDSRPELWGTLVDDRKVIGLDEAAARGIRTYAVGSLGSVGAIRALIGGHPTARAARVVAARGA
jgi:hypothetical protein